LKNTLRQEKLQKRKEVPEADRQKESSEIISFICNSKRYGNAETVFTFISMDKEVNTHPLIEQAWQDGKKVAVPIAKKGGRMYFVNLSSFLELKKSPFGVMEPQKEETEAVIPRENDIFLVPGSVFDKKGNRYGYGGGFYDRYLQQYSEIYKIGVAFSFQVVEFDLQVDGYDIPVDCIVTEKGLIGGSNHEYFD